MCTIVVLHQVRSDRPVVVAATRDELYSRPASVPRLLCKQPRAAGGVDEERGGTWMGLTDAGLFVGLTNQRSAEGFDSSLQSRGQVALDALSAGSADGIRELLARLDARCFNAFNLIFGDRDRVFVAYARREHQEAEVHELGPGLHVLTNDRIGSPHFPKAHRAAALARGALQAPWPDLRNTLVRMLGDHQLPEPEAIPDSPEAKAIPPSLLRPLQAICVHTEHYGTRSATLLTVDSEGRSGYEFAAGPPCTHPFEDFTDLLREAR